MASPPSPRIVNRDGTFNFQVTGRNNATLADLYHFLMRASWRWLLGAIVVAYLSINLAFALGYWLVSDQVANMAPDSFGDAFFFSVQTLATIGYGAMAPTGPVAHGLVTAEALVGLLGVAMVSGLMFAKFSRPTARIAFSNVALIAPWNGTPTFLFRMANERANQVTSAEVTVVLTRDERTAEGAHIRRFYDLVLQRNKSAMFALTWAVYHTIDEHSPLYGETPESLARRNAAFIITVSGIDDTFASSIHARHAYSAADLRWNHRFVDVVEFGDGDVRIIHFERLHDAVPLADGPTP